MSKKIYGSRIYGSGRDLVVCDGDVHGSVSCPVNNAALGVLLVGSDGTLLEAKRSPLPNGGCWRITALKHGSIFAGISEPELDHPESDCAHFHEGLVKVYVALKWGEARQARQPRARTA